MIERGREWGGPRYVAVVGEPTVWRLGRCRCGPDGGGGRHVGGAGIRRGPGGGRRGAGVDPVVVGEASAWTRWRWRCGGSPGAGA
jgi:hypothetical protein